MDELAANLCQELFKATRASPGAGESSLERPEMLLRKLSEDGYNPELIEQAEKVLGLLKDWALPAGWERHAQSAEEFRGRVLGLLGELLRGGLLDDRQQDVGAAPSHGRA